MRRYASYALITVALLTFVVWLVSQFIQPILPASTNAGLVLFIAALLGVVGILGGFKNVVELFRSLGEHSSKSPNVVTGPVQVVFGNVTVNVSYIVQSTAVQLVNVPTVTIQPKAQTNEKPVPRQAPPVPSGLTGRVAEIASLKQILLQESQTVGLVSLQGMGGIGKTALAAALAHDPDIEREFFDGTLWAYVDRYRDLREILPQWIHALNPSEQAVEPSETTQLLNRFHALTQTRRILIVLDGVDKENAPQLQSLIKAIGTTCKVLVTSRVVALPGIQTLVSLDVLPESESLLLLEKELGRRFTAQERAVAREIVFLLGYHPLALKIVGARMRATGIGLEQYREKLHTEIGTTRTLELDDVRERSAGNIRNTLDLSYDQLPVQEQNRLRQLTVFATQSFDMQSASDTWGIDLPETKNLLSTFVATAFLNFKDGFYTMHPLVYEYLKGLPDTPRQ